MTIGDKIASVDAHIEKIKEEFEYFLETDQLLSAAAAQGRIDDLHELRNLLKQRKVEQEAKEALGIR